MKEGIYLFNFNYLIEIKNIKIIYYNKRITSNYYNKNKSLNESYLTNKNQVIVVEEKVDFQNYNSTNK